MTSIAAPRTIRLPVFAEFAARPNFNHGFSDHILEKKILQLSKQKSSLTVAFEDATLCVVCMESPRSAVLLHPDGGCAVACEGCAAALREHEHDCPQCQRPFLSFVSARF